MAYKIALTATGPLSGKSTLAKYLHDQFGFVLASHVHTLVESFVAHYNGNLPHDSRITVDDVFAHKERYRLHLQEWGNYIGFNDEDAVGDWIEETVRRSGWTEGSGQGIVFDSFRGEVQAEHLRSTGWTLVQLIIPEYERECRAGRMGKDYSDVKAAMQISPELELGIANPDIVLRSDVPVSVEAAYLMQILSYQAHKGSVDNDTLYAGG